MNLKVGSTGELVKQVQRIVGVDDDGIFGPKTEAAVKVWQGKHYINQTGIVDSITWSAMGVASSDLSERKDFELDLNIKRHYLPAGEYCQGPTKKEWVFLHHTAGWEDPYKTIDCWAADTRGAVGTEFVLGGQNIKVTDLVDHEFDGELVQAFPKTGYGWHLGVGYTAMHLNSVGIEICNFGQLTKGGYFKWDPVKKKNVWIALDSKKFYNYVGVAAEPSQIIKLSAPFRGFEYWHKYSDKQIEVLRNWILYIGERDEIDVRKGLPALIKQIGVAAFDKCDVKMCESTKGLWAHVNVQKGKFDVFPQPEMVDMLLSL